MPSNYFECCPCVNPMDSVPEALSNIVKYNKKQDVEIEKRVNEDALSKVAKSGRYGDLIDKPVALPNPQPITINGQRYDGSEAVTVTVSSEGGGTPVEIDDTLTQSGKAADAKVVGDQLSALNEANSAQDTEIAKKANESDLAAVAKSGSYNDLTNKPTIPSAYTLPTASASVLGGVMPVAKTDDMTQAVGVDAQGGLWAQPGWAGGLEWRKINTITISEPVASVTIDKDSEGNAFDLDEIYIFTVGLKSDSTSSGQHAKLTLNGNIVKTMYTGNVFSSISNQKGQVWFNRLFMIETNSPGNTTASSAVFENHTTNGEPMSEKISKVTIAAWSATLTGGTIKLYGR